MAELTHVEGRGMVDQEADQIVQVPRARTVEAEAHEAVGWDDRKELADLWQDNGGPVGPGGLHELYPALVAVALEGARRAVENMLGD